MPCSQYELCGTVLYFLSSYAAIVHIKHLLQIRGCCIAGSSSGTGPVIMGGATLFAVIMTSVAFLPC